MAISDGRIAPDGRQAVNPDETSTEPSPFYLPYTVKW